MEDNLKFDTLPEELVDEEDIVGVDSVGNQGGGELVESGSTVASKDDIKMKLKSSVKLALGLCTALVIAIILIKSFGVKNEVDVKDSSEQANVVLTEVETVVQKPIGDTFLYSVDRTEIATMPIVTDTIFDDVLNYKKCIVKENNSIYFVLYGNSKYYGKPIKVYVTPTFYQSIASEGNVSIKFSTAKIEGEDYLINANVTGVLE